ncbi:MAG TPA: Rid family hydrolase [Gemmatimonadales bacterium]|nr:Rid family hydrolase [Gemmatimonadales bacterium]
MKKHHRFEGTSVPAAYGPYSHAVEAGDFVFLAGQTARDAVTGKVIPGDVFTQTQRCLEIISDILARMGLSLSDVVRSTVYLANIDDFAEMNRAYSAAFPEPYPARSTPEARIPFGALVSIEVTALRKR